MGSLIKNADGETNGHVFVDRLGVGELCRLAFSRSFRIRHSKVVDELCVIDGVSRGARLLARLLSIFGIRIRIHELEYDFVDDVRLSDGGSVRDEIFFNAVPMLVGQIERSEEYVPSILHLAQKKSHRRYIHAYLSKRICYELYRELRSVLVSAWYSRVGSGRCHQENVLYMRDGILFEPLSEYAVKWNVVLRRLPSGVGSLGGVGGQLRALLRPAYHWLRSFGRAHARLEGRAPRVAVEMYFSGIMRQPIYNTEFFWYREPSLPRGAVFAYFAHAEDQATKPRQAILSDAGIGWMAKTDLHRIMDAHWSHIGRPREPADVRASGTAGTKIRKVLRRYVTDFYSEHDRWCRFFTATGTRIHVSTSDSFPASEALHAALADVGGVSVSIPRAIERTPNIFRRTVTDVHFAFSRAQSDREGLSGSSVRQFITSGYLFDDAFPAAMEFAREIVSQLRARGVTFTVCFLDENAGVDRKMYGGGRLTQSDYAFLCDRLAVDESLGLILKPKRSDTLPERLGPVWPRVEEFMRTGRCVLLDGGSTDERYLPCAGACAADIAVNMLRGATAGLESYLAGTRTLLIRHGEDLGVFERLPQGSVVFDTWDELWRAVERFRADPADPNIGNWEPIIEEFASLRDSCASKRISSYITALYEAFASGKSREEAMGHAGRRYADMWGADLITPIVGAWPQHAQAVRAQRDDWLQVGLRA